MKRTELLIIWESLFADLPSCYLDSHLWEEVLVESEMTCMGYSMYPSCSTVNLSKKQQQRHILRHYLGHNLYCTSRPLNVYLRQRVLGNSNSWCPCVCCIENFQPHLWHLFLLLVGGSKCFCACVCMFCLFLFLQSFHSSPFPLGS